MEKLSPLKSSLLPQKEENRQEKDEARRLSCVKKFVHCILSTYIFLSFCFLFWFVSKCKRITLGDLLNLGILFFAGLGLLAGLCDAVAELSKCVF